MIGSIGFPEVIMIFLVVLLLFGPKKLPDFAKMFGKTLKEFRKTINDAKSTIEDEIEKAGVAEDLKEIKEIRQDINSIAKFDVEEYYKSDEDDGVKQKDKQKDESIAHKDPVVNKEDLDKEDKKNIDGKKETTPGNSDHHDSGNNNSK
jgi:TatA/E family protein of Tat protein translocase